MRRVNTRALCLGIFVCVVGVLAACDRAPPETDRFLGRWESHSFSVEIRRDGDAYSIDLDNHRGMLSGHYVGEVSSGGLKLHLPLAGDQLMLISRSGGELEFIGEVLQKVDDF